MRRRQLVQALQRTLNARATPSRSSVDGDFAPRLNSSEAFQQVKQLAVTGIANVERSKPWTAALSTTKSMSRRRMMANS